MTCTPYFAHTETLTISTFSTYYSKSVMCLVFEFICIHSSLAEYSNIYLKILRVFLPIVLATCFRVFWSIYLFHLIIFWHSWPTVQTLTLWQNMANVTKDFNVSYPTFPHIYVYTYNSSGTHEDSHSLYQIRSKQI